MRIKTMHDLASAAMGRRLELGLTQAELAGRAGVSRDWVNYFERGKRTVDLSLVLRILDALAIDIEVMDASEPTVGAAQPTGPDLDTILDRYLGQ
jgi:transcriptional regulator with XRE-family HTH domain